MTETFTLRKQDRNIHQGGYLLFKTTFPIFPVRPTPFLADHIATRSPKLARFHVTSGKELAIKPA